MNEVKAMKIIDLLKPQGVLLGQSPADKAAAYDLLIGLQEKVGNLSDVNVYRQGIEARDEEGPTAIGEGIAIPHAKSDGVKQPGVVAMTVPQGVDCQALDEQPSNLFFMLAAPKDGSDVHLEVLSHLSTILMDDDFREGLVKTQSVEAFLEMIDAKEAEKYPQEVVPEPEVTKNEKYDLLAVTACPTGIAHTYMAAEALEKEAGKMGYTIKVETNGSGGVKNELTAEEIAGAKGIIIAADKKVETARFDGKKLVQTPVSEGIHKPAELIEEVLDEKTKVFHSNEKAEVKSTGKESIGHQIYKHLMNGVSHMLPFVTGGGILIALAFLFDTFDAANPGNFGMGTPVSAFLKSVGGQAFGFMLPVLAGYIAMSIADVPGLAVGFVGGMIANLGMTLSNPTGENAVSAGFIGALIAGFVAGYLVLLLKKIFTKLPKSLEGIKPVLLYPLLGIFLIGLIMCAINPVVAMLNEGLSHGLTAMGSGSKILLGCVLGGMMSIDMGGPFNKAAYVFGTASIASGNLDIMAAVMVGGMVPPLVIALCTTFFKNRFTGEERKSGIVNYVMGLCFISEGAIPFAAADPIRVIPSCIIGSAVAGGLSLAFGCPLRAPHGGIFLVGVVGNPLMYLIALAAGSLVGMILLAILKKPVKE